MIANIPKLTYPYALGARSFSSLPPSSGNTGIRFRKARNKFISSAAAKKSKRFTAGPEKMTKASEALESGESYFNPIPKAEDTSVPGFPPAISKAAR